MLVDLVTIFPDYFAPLRLSLLGRAVDSQVTGSGMPYRRDSLSNRRDFERMFNRWAKSSVDGLAELKARSPVPGTVAVAK